MHYLIISLTFLMSRVMANLFMYYAKDSEKNFALKIKEW